MTTPEWTIPAVLQLSGGYWSACALHAGVALGLFAPLADERLDAAGVAAACSADPRATAMLLDALTALGLVAKRDDIYEATPFSARYLASSSPDYLGHIIFHHHHLMGGWARLHEAVAAGKPLRERVSHGDDRRERESFLMGMYNLASQLAPQVAAGLDLSGCSRLLDMGGGPGTYAVHFCLRNPQLTAVVYDLPTTREFAEGVISRHGVQERVSFVSGDFHADGVPGGFDAAWLSHILHSDGPQGCAVILGKGVSALRPGGMLYVQEFILDDDKSGPLFPALFSLNMLQGTPAGQAYSGAEIRAMMEQAGLTDVRRLDAPLPNGAGIMAGRLPG